jgi:hypothetical protein
MLAQIVFTFVVMIRAGLARVRAAKDGRIKGDIRLSQRGWPDDVMQRVNNMNNQFETPTLFYALTILALSLQIATWPIAALAWAYVVSRVAHMVVHTGRNDILLRFRIFFAGLVCLMLMTAVIALQVLSAG